LTSGTHRAHAIAVPWNRDHKRRFTLIASRLIPAIV
jgi:hypothetical protein